MFLALASSVSRTLSIALDNKRKFASKKNFALGQQGENHYTFFILFHKILDISIFNRSFGKDIGKLETESFMFRSPVFRKLFSVIKPILKRSK